MSDNKIVETVDLDKGTDEYEAIVQMARDDLAMFSCYVDPNYEIGRFHEEIINKLHRVAEWKCKRLLVCLPPGSGKSRLVTQLFPARTLGNHPEKKIVVTWYWQDLPNYFSTETQAVVNGEYYKDLFDTEYQTEKVQHRQTKQWWYYHAVWVWWPLTWYRFDIGIIDDPIKNRQEAESMTIREKINWRYTSTFYTRRLNQDSAIIIVLTRWHIRDIIGFIDDNSSEEREKVIVPALTDTKDEQWYKTYTSYRPERFSVEDLIHTRELLPLRDWMALYMQDPVASTGSIFKPPFKYEEYYQLFEWTQAYRKEDIMIGIFIDPAFSTSATSDDASIIVWWKHKITRETFLFDWYADTSAPSVTIERALMMADQRRIMWFTNIFISCETVTINKDQMKFLKDLYEAMKLRWVQYPIFEFKPKWNKLDRIRFALEPVFTNRWITFVKSWWDILWMRKAEEQLTSFPACDKIDVLDTIAQAEEVLLKRIMWVDPNAKPRERPAYTNKITGEVVEDNRARFNDIRERANRPWRERF